MLLETWQRWRGDVEAAGMAFAAAPEYPVFPRGDDAFKPYAAVVRSVAETRPVLAGFSPDVVVQDILTLAPALAAELEGVPCATLIPHVHPWPPPGAPTYSIGARWPRTPIGRRFWTAVAGPMEAGLRKGRDELNETRRRLGLAPREELFGGLSRDLVMVATFPQLEYPRRWRAWEHVVGPLLWEPPWDEDPEPPPGAGPVVLVAPSTAQDPTHRLLRAALAGLADEPVRVLAATNRRALPEPVRIPPNARVVDWISYARAMPRADVVICHGGHGTLVRALAAGCAVVVVPAAGDQAENAARADWAGVGVRLASRLLSPATLRLAVRRALGDGGARRTLAGDFSAWAARHDGTARAAALVEELATRGARSSAGDAAAR